MLFDIIKDAGDDFPIPTFESDSIFIGREHQIDLFEVYYTRWKKILFDTVPEDPLVTSLPSPDNKIQSLVVLLYGRGGFGKSTLLRRYQKMVLQDNQNPLFLGETTVSKIIDWESATRNKRSLFILPEGQDIDAYEYYTIICRELAESLGKKPQDFREYQSVLKTLGKTRKKASEVLDTMQKQDHYSWLRGLTVDFVTSTIRSRIPGSNLVLDNPNVKLAVNEVAKLTQEQIEQVSSRLYNRLGSDLSDYLEAPVQLGLAIGNDLSHFAKNSPLLIYFDTYEEIDEGDQLLRIIVGAAGIRVGWIIAGRDNLWAGTEQRRRSIDLEYSYKDIVLSDRGFAIDFNAGGVGAFTVSDIAEYFSQIRKNVQYEPPLPVVTKKNAADILDVTQGVPLAVYLAGILYVETANLEIITKKPEGKRKIVDEMVQRYLRHTRSNQIERAKLYGLALLRRVDRPTAVASAIGLTAEQAKTGYQIELSRLHRRYSFVFTEGNSPSLHKEVRHFLRLWLLENRNFPEIVVVNGRLKESLLSELKELEKSNLYADLRSRLEDEEWVGIYLDIIEQVFWLNPTEGVHHALLFMIAASIYLREANLNVVELGKFFETIIPQPHLKYWKWATQSLAYKSSYNLSREELSALESLERLVHQQQYLDSPLDTLSKDCKEELEAAIRWRLGEAYIRDDDKRALEWFEKAQNQLGQNPEFRQVISEITHYLGHKSFENENYIEAKTFFDRAINVDPTEAYLYSDRGSTYAQLKDYQQAVDDFSHAIKLNPTHASYYLNRARFYITLEKYKEAFSDLNHTIRLDPDNKMAYYLRGNLFALDEFKDYKRAIADFSYNIKLEPNFHEAYFSRGNCYALLEDYKKAIDDYDIAIKLDDKKEKYYLSRSKSHLSLKNYKNAIDDCTYAISLNPNDNGYYHRGNCYMQFEDYERAIDDYNCALELDDKNGEYYINRGKAFSKVEEYQRSILDYDRAIELDNKLEHTAQKEKGLALIKLEKFKEALDILVKALILEPSCGECWGALTKVLYISHIPADIYHIIKEIPIEKDTNGYGFIRRARFMAAIGQYPQALENFNCACKIQKELVDKTYCERGLVLSYLERYSEAVEIYKRDLRKNGANISVLYNIAVAMARWKGVATCQEHINVARIELLKSINSNDRVAALYGLGGLYALEEEIEKSLDYLQQAIACSDVAVHWAQHDMAWLDLRTDTRFQSLIGDQR